MRSAVVDDAPVNPEAALKSAVERAFRTLPDKYLGAPRGFNAVYHVRLGDVGSTWEVELTEHVARVRRGPSRSPDVIIGTDGATWLALREGETSGLDAFRQRRLYVRGRVDLALRFEALFRLPGGRDPLLRLDDVELSGRRVSVLTLGEGPDVLLIHGLGAAKTSFFDTAAAVRHAGFRVHVVDLPGFGASSAPLTAPYDAPWFADTILRLMDARGIDRAHLVGNSMGGKISLEVGLRAPERVRSLGLLAPAVAFVRRSLHPLVRALRPEVGLLPHGFRRSMVAGQLKGMLGDPDAMDPSVADVAVDEFQRTYSSPGARLAFLRSARNLYLDAPYGPRGFYPRLAQLQPPALFVWGTEDPLIPAAFARHVARWLPSAEQVVLQGCGHIPQIEQPEHCAGLIMRFLASADADLEQPGRADAQPLPLAA